MVLRSKTREEAIQLIIMDPKVSGKLITTHRRGYGVDVEALHGWFPLRQSAGEGSKIGSHGYRRLPWWKLCFVVPMDVFGVRRYIQEEEVRRWTPEGPTRQGGALLGGRALLSRGSLGAFLTCTPGSPGQICSKNYAPEGHSVWTPFDIPYLRNTEIGKKNSNMGWASGQQVSPKNDNNV